MAAGTGGVEGGAVVARGTAVAGTVVAVGTGVATGVAVGTGVGAGMAVGTGVGAGVAVGTWVAVAQATTTRNATRSSRNRLALRKARFISLVSFSAELKGQVSGAIGWRGCGRHGNGGRTALVGRCG